MSINRSYIIAALAVIGIGIWFWINSDTDQAQSPAPISSALDFDESAPLPRVIVEPRRAQTHKRRIELYGRTAANRVVDIKAKTAGLIVATPLKEGRKIESGTVICRQDIDARKAVLDQATALLTTRQLEYEAALKLVEKGFRSETQAATARAALDGAKASVKQAEIELDNVNMRAPFSGIFDDQMAELGDYLGPGQACGRLIELNPLVVEMELTETQIGQIKVGQSADIRLNTGQNLSGTLRFIEAQADPSTRTFKAEISLPNPKLTLKAGVTATLFMEAGEILAQHIPSSILALDDQGRVGVRYIDDGNIVRFAEVKTIDEDPDGIWVTGLPDTTRIIIKGQDYVAINTEVEPRTALEESVEIVSP